MLHPGDPQASPCHGLEVKMSNCTLPLDRRFVTWVAETRGLVWRVQRHSLWKWANCPLICSMWIGDMIWLEIVDSSYPILRQTNIFHAMISTFLKRDGNLTNRNSESVLTVTICENERLADACCFFLNPGYSCYTTFVMITSFVFHGWQTHGLLSGMSSQAYTLSNATPGR